MALLCWPFLAAAQGDFKGVIRATPHPALSPIEAERLAAIVPDGRVCPGVSVTNVSIGRICRAGYASVIGGGMRDVSKATRRAVFLRDLGYVPRDAWRFEVDHLWPVGLGGANCISNLWVESGDGVWSFHVKDRLEDFLRARLVRDFKVNGAGHAEALRLQLGREISLNWTNCYLHYLGEPPGLTHPPTLGSYGGTRRRKDASSSAKASADRESQREDLKLDGKELRR